MWIGSLIMDSLLNKYLINTQNYLKTITIWHQVLYWSLISYKYKPPYKFKWKLACLYKLSMFEQCWLSNRKTLMERCHWQFHFHKVGTSFLQNEKLKKKSKARAFQKLSALADTHFQLLPYAEYIFHFRID